LAILVIVAAGLLTVRISSDGEAGGGGDVGMMLILGALLAVVFFVGFSLVLQLAGVDGEAPAIAQHLAADPLVPSSPRCITPVERAGRGRHAWRCAA
jgi:hypothetical protein